MRNEENVTIICFKEQRLHLQKNKRKKQQYVTYNNTFFASVKYIKTHLITYWYCVWNLQYWNILQNGRWMKVNESNAQIPHWPSVKHHLLIPVSIKTLLINNDLINFQPIYEIKVKLKKQIQISEFILIHPLFPKTHF